MIITRVTNIANTPTVYGEFHLRTYSLLNVTKYFAAYKSVGRVRNKFNRNNRAVEILRRVETATQLYSTYKSEHAEWKEKFGRFHRKQFVKCPQYYFFIYTPYAFNRRNKRYSAPKYSPNVSKRIYHDFDYLLESLAAVNLSLRIIIINVTTLVCVTLQITYHFVRLKRSSRFVP